MVLGLLLLLQSPSASLEALESELVRALAAGDQNAILRQFKSPEDGEYLFRMARARGGLSGLSLSMVPTPKGWEGTGEHWAIFHTTQYIESHHDPVYGVHRQGNGWVLGKEVLEESAGFAQPETARIKANLVPAMQILTVNTTLRMKPYTEKKALVFRLNHLYHVSTAEVDGRKPQVITVGMEPRNYVRDPLVIRAGSLLIVNQLEPVKNLTFIYSGSLKAEREDQLNERYAHISSWWVPTLARLPFKTETTVHGPADWEIRSEGELVKSEVVDTAGKKEKVVTYRCDVPISYPKIVGGQYVKAAELRDNGRLFRSYQFEPVDKERAETDVKLAADAVRFFESKLVKFPFSGYDCFDAVNYYGIESYSYTLLSPRITTRYVAHEIGHTYFGGIAPSAYVRDSWNEGVTTYVDDVLTGRMIDQPLQNALASLDVAVPLSEMAIPHDYRSASYFRGAAVMKMLEYEIGAENVLVGLRDILTNRVGKGTTWPDLRAHFEKAGGKPLDWFWKQWVDGAVFPTLEVTSAEATMTDDGVVTRVSVKQSGTPAPYRVRCKIVLEGGEPTEREVVLTGSSTVVPITTAFRPTEVRIDVIGMALARVGKPVEVKLMELALLGARN